MWILWQKGIRLAIHYLENFLHLGPTGSDMCSEALLSSDASGGWGCGATFQDNWLHIGWPGEWRRTTITAKELVPIVLALGTWGKLWTGYKVCALCDNSAVVFAVNKKSAQDPALSHLLQHLCILCALFDIHLVAKHLPGYLVSHSLSPSPPIRDLALTQSL